MGKVDNINDWHFSNQNWKKVLDVIWDYAPNRYGRGKEDYTDRLKNIRAKEIAQRMSLVGPHRDDFQFSVNGINMNLFGSRGQQRTIALSLKLAEARFIHSKKDDHPILLLDDMLSELDSARRHHILESISSYEQVIMTTIDLDRFAPDFLAQASLFEVGGGKIEPR